MGFKEEREKSVITQCKETLKESLEKLSALQQFISQVKREIEQAVIEELTDLGLKKKKKKMTRLKMLFHLTSGHGEGT